MTSKGRTEEGVAVMFVFHGSRGMSESEIAAAQGTCGSHEVMRNVRPSDGEARDEEMVLMNIRKTVKKVNENIRKSP